MTAKSDPAFRQRFGGLVKHRVWPPDLERIAGGGNFTTSDLQIDKRSSNYSDVEKTPSDAQMKLQTMLNEIANDAQMKLQTMLKCNCKRCSNEIANDAQM
jgi:hypothetical protein